MENQTLFQPYIDEKLTNFINNFSDADSSIYQFVKGEFKSSSNMNSVNFPFDNSLAFRYFSTDIKDVEESIEFASQNLDIMRDLTLYERSQILLNTANLLNEHKEEMAKIVVLETGKTINDSRGEIIRAISTLNFAAEATKALNGETLPLDAMNGVGKRISFIMHEPLGVIGAITGFNFPVLLAVHKLGPAFGAGNTVVLKPSPGTPVSSIALAWMFEKAGLPKGALSVVNGDIPVGEVITKHPKVAAISFTGSSKIGRIISKQAEYKKVLLELGSNAATIVDSRKDLETIASKLIVGGFASNGQSCISVQRILVRKEFKKDLLEKLESKIKELKIGNPFDDDTKVSALFNPNANNRILSWIEEAVNDGARIITGGKVTKQILEPTLLVDVKPEMNIFQEEIFGPVILVTEFDSFDEAINLVNNSEYGLQVGVFTEDLQSALKAISNIRSGSVHINEISNFRPDHMPYGGVKESGIGKEGPKYVLEELSNKKVVSIKL